MDLKIYTLNCIRGLRLEKGNPTNYKWINSLNSFERSIWGEEEESRERERLNLKKFEN